MPRGTKLERNSVSKQPHEIKYEAYKLDVKLSAIKDAKKGGSNQRKDIEKKVNSQKPHKELFGLRNFT